MIQTISLTEEGKKLAATLIAEHLDGNGLEVGVITRITSEQVMLVLISYGAMQTESRTEAWYQGRLDEILGL
jgi:DNA-binding MarR family transcriptional regulator